LTRRDLRPVARFSRTKQLRPTSTFDKQPTGGLDVPGELGSPGGKAQVAPHGGRTPQTDPRAEKVLECGSHTAALPVEPIFSRERPEDFFNTLWLLPATIFCA